MAPSLQPYVLLQLCTGSFPYRQTHACLSFCGYHTSYIRELNTLESLNPRLWCWFSQLKREAVWHQFDLEMTLGTSRNSTELCLLLVNGASTGIYQRKPNVFSNGAWHCNYVVSSHNILKGSALFVSMSVNFIIYVAKYWWIIINFSMFIDRDLWCSLSLVICYDAI